MRVKECECGVSIVMRKNQATGKWAPITARSYPSGNVAINTDQTWRVIGKDEAFAGPRYLNHFSDCERAKNFGGDRAGKPEYREPGPRQSGLDLGPDPTRFDR